MKKLVSLLLALVMVLTAACFASAEEGAFAETVTAPPQIVTRPPPAWEPPPMPAPLWPPVATSSPVPSACP